MADTDPDPLKQSADTAIAVIEAPPKKKKRNNRDRNPTDNPPPYHVVIWNDEEHSYDYVIELLMVLFNHSLDYASKITHEVDKVGKGIAFTTHMELAELKRDQILAYGADWRMPKVSKGSIRATIEPAPE